jgi:hypothetical protein
MNAPTHVTPKPEPKSEATLKLIAARFVTPIQFAGVTDSVRIGANCLTICPARIEPDGSAIPSDKGQASQGLLIRGNGRGFHTQSFAPWANVAELMYGPGDK